MVSALVSSAFSPSSVSSCGASSSSRAISAFSQESVYRAEVAGEVGVAYLPHGVGLALVVVPPEQVEQFVDEHFLQLVRVLLRAKARVETDFAERPVRVSPHVPLVLGLHPGHADVATLDAVDSADPHWSSLPSGFSKRTSSHGCSSPIGWSVPLCRGCRRFTAPRVPSPSAGRRTGRGRS